MAEVQTLHWSQAQIVALNFKIFLCHHPTSPTPTPPPYRTRPSKQQLIHSLIQIIWGYTLLWSFHWLHFWSLYFYVEMKRRIWFPNLHMNIPLYLLLHVVLCNLQFKHHANVTIVNILVLGVPMVLPNTAAHNSVWMKNMKNFVRRTLVQNLLW